MKKEIKQKKRKLQKCNFVQKWKIEVPLTTLAENTFSTTLGMLLKNNCGFLIVITNLTYFYFFTDENICPYDQHKHFTILFF